jgi:hypothetical protein
MLSSGSLKEIITECDELISIFVSSVKTAKVNLGARRKSKTQS